MKLHWSPRSPYVRKVMIFAHETGLVNRIDCIRSVAIRTKINPDILEDSPVGKIPVMVLDNKTVLSGSYSICEYLDSLHEGRKIIPPASEEKWRELELYGIADGLLDTLLTWRGELMRPESARDAAIINTCALKTQACLDWLENRSQAFADEAYGIGQMTSGIVLDYLDFRFNDIGWRNARQSLANWHQLFLSRPSSQATEIVNDE